MAVKAYAAPLACPAWRVYNRRCVRKIGMTALPSDNRRSGGEMMAAPGLTRAIFEALAAPVRDGNASIDHDEAYRLRGRIIGAMIRQARLAAECEADACARRLSLGADDFSAWEYGERAPSLPQVEALARYLAAPESAKEPSPDQAEEYQRLRQRLLGALLQRARKSQDLEADELCAPTGLDAATLERYEYGETAIPLHHLAALAGRLRQDLRLFADPKGPSRKPEAPGARDAAHKAESSDLETFANDQRNRAFIRLAMAFRDIDRGDLNRIASALLAIIGEGRNSKPAPG